MSLTDSIAGEIRAILARKNKTKKDLAAALGCSPGYLGKLISGSIPITVDQIEATASFLDIPLMDLLSASAKEVGR